jgi:hypothetical protein
MGLSGTLRRVNWPAIVSGTMHVLSATSLIVLSKRAMDNFSFPFPATLALLHHSGIAGALWFWTIFGLFRPRSLPFLPTAQLAAASALCCALSMLSLRHNSLAVYQAMRMSAAPTALIIERMLGRTGHLTEDLSQFGYIKRSVSDRVCVSGAVLFIAIALLARSDKTLTRAGAVCGGFSALSSAMYQTWSRPARESARGNELQLQLYTRTLGAFSLVPLLPVLDNYSLTSPQSIFQMPFNESTAIIVLATILLAFLSFVAMRVTVSRASPRFYSATISAISGLLFVADLELYTATSSFSRMIFTIIIFFSSTTLLHTRQNPVHVDQGIASWSSRRVERASSDVDTVSSARSVD